MINKISFKNYKIFKEKQTLELKPITIIIGKNNSGKSVVSKLPTLIEGALSSDSEEALKIINDGVELGSELRDLVYGRANRVIELEFENNTSENRYKLTVGILISNDKNKQTAVIDYWTLNDVIDLHFSGNETTYIDDISKIAYNCSFKGLRLDSFIKVDERQIKKAHINPKIALFMENFNLNTDFIGPIRVQPNRDYRLPPMEFVEKSGPKGENAYYYLIDDALTSDKRLISKVAKWYKENFEGWELKINQDKAPIFQIEIQREDLKQNILDAGIGMSQVLPIVTRAFHPCEEETLIIIEEPETHLHPGAHGNLAELFVQTIAQGNKKYLIETHSLNFILRLRRLVAEKRLHKEDLAIYYVDFLEEKNFSILRKIEVDDFGRVSHWPEGVFNETLDETIAIRTAQIENPEYGNRN